jgi:hypothetical protein
VWRESLARHAKHQRLVHGHKRMKRKQTETVLLDLREKNKWEKRFWGLSGLWGNGNDKGICVVTA